LNLVIFEDERHPAFGIVTVVRAVFDLRCGGRTLLERWQAAEPGCSLHLLVRPEHAALAAEMHPGVPVNAAAAGEAWFGNGRWLGLGGDWLRTHAHPAPEFAVWSGSALVAARTRSATTERLGAELQRRAGPRPGLEPLNLWTARELPQLLAVDLAASPDWTRDGSTLLDHVWQLVQHNGRAICDDFRSGPAAGIDPSALVYPGVHLLQDGAIRVGPGCRVKPGVVLDAEDGPIVLERDVEVQPGVVIRGPAWIGPGCVLKAGAKIHEGTALGPVCKIGGEVEESIVQGYSNKQHEGFLGHAFLAEWVNLGADTNNSDLKNNYSTVRAWEAGQMRDTGLMFVGLIAGDHAKSAINTQFNTGTVVGAGAQVFGAGFPPKFVPPFSWGGGEGLAVYRFDRALETARAVMRRRKIDMTAAYEAALQREFAAWEHAPRSHTAAD